MGGTQGVSYKFYDIEMINRVQRRELLNEFKNKETLLEGYICKPT